MNELEWRRVEHIQDVSTTEWMVWHYFRYEWLVLEKLKSFMSFIYRVENWTFILITEMQRRKCGDSVSAHESHFSGHRCRAWEFKWLGKCFGEE